MRFADSYFSLRILALKSQYHLRLNRHTHQLLMVIFLDNKINQNFNGWKACR